MSLLTITQEVADRVGLPLPSAVVGSSNLQVRQLLSLSNQVGKALSKVHDWQALTRETTFVATATETQTGALPAALERIVPRTFWNRTQDRRVTGPVSAQAWQALQTGLITMPSDAFRLRGSALLMTPAPTAGDVMAYEYITKSWCMGAGDTTPDQEAWAADDDISIWDDEVIILGTIWRYQKSRGLEYGETFRDYEVEVSRLISHDGGLADIAMTTADSTWAEPTLADGNWSIT